MIDLEHTDKKYLRVDEVMTLFTVSRRCAYYWIENGTLPSITIGRTIRIPVAPLRRLLKTDPLCSPLVVHSVQSVQR